MVVLGWTGGAPLALDGAVDARGSREPLLSTRKSAGLVTGPTQAVEIGWIERAGGDRFANQGRTLFEPLAAIDPGIAEIILEPDRPRQPFEQGAGDLNVFVLAP